VNLASILKALQEASETINRETRAKATRHPSTRSQLHQFKPVTPSSGPYLGPARKRKVKTPKRPKRPEAPIPDQWGR